MIPEKLSVKFLWSGLTIVLAVPAVLHVFGLNGSEVIVALGALVMAVGAVMLDLNK